MVIERRKTAPSQLLADRVSTWVFRLTGLGVIAAVLGMLVFFLATVLPLFSPPQLTLLSQRPEAFFGQLESFRRDSIAPFLIEVVSDQKGTCRLLSAAAPLHHEGKHAQALQSLSLAEVSGTPVDVIGSGAGSPDFSRRGMSSEQTYWCRGIGPSLILTASAAVRSGDESVGTGSATTFSVSEILISRRFLGSTEVASLSQNVLSSLDQRGWAVQDRVFYARASSQAPVAILSPALRSVVTFSQADAQWSEWLRQSGLKVSLQTGVDGRFLLRGSETREDNVPAVKHLLLIQTKENRITGQKVSQAAELVFFKEMAPVSVDLTGASQAVSFVNQDGSVRLIGWDQLWESAASGNDGFSRTADGRRALVRSGGHSVTVSGAFLSFGGNTLVTLFRDGSCAGYDLAYAYLNPGLDVLSPRWEAFCHWPGEVAQAAAASPTQRLAVILSDSGHERMVDLTTGDVVLEGAFGAGETGSNGVLGSAYELSFDASGLILALVQGKMAPRYYQLDSEELEGSVSRMFRMIHYEGYPDASLTWQSASGSDDFESKYSLWPLIWGTLKATLYALAFAAPLGIFAAVYSSEILDRSTRNFVKPAIEMMASLPSVVLGFLAAIVLAPWIERNILGVLLCGLVLPFGLYFFGNLISRYSARHVSGRGLYASRRLLFLILGGILVSFVLLLHAGSLIERLAFGRDFKAFLAGGPGSSAILYGILLLPLCLIGLWSIPAGRFVKTWKTVVFVLGPLISMLIGAALFSFVGDSGLVVGGYAQRNALVICIAMGFAIIPIIYSLSEDALTAVPGSLRAGSLACGASVWQTTAKVVLPTAASGIFSALMVGFGRAIGETMIVVMATGNSALMSFNPFEGLRTLAANIAVELPEAPRGGAHYRILFFSGLVLFALTFVLNTLAEALRTRYRKRNKAL